LSFGQADPEIERLMRIPGVGRIEDNNIKDVRLKDMMLSRRANSN